LLSSFFLHNLFKALSYSFFAVIHIIDLELISNILIERLQWTNSVVIQNLIILLDKDNNIQDKYIETWQVETQQVIKEKWQQVEYLKYTIFKEKFFFYCHEHHLSHSNSENSSSVLLDNKMSTVADSEEDRLVNYY